MSNIFSETHRSFIIFWFGISTFDIMLLKKVLGWNSSKILFFFHVETNLLSKDSSNKAGRVWRAPVLSKCIHSWTLQLVHGPVSFLHKKAHKIPHTWSGNKENVSAGLSILQFASDFGIIDETLSFDSCVKQHLNKLKPKPGFFVETDFVAATLIPVLDCADIIYRNASASCLTQKQSLSKCFNINYRK